MESKQAIPLLQELVDLAERGALVNLEEWQGRAESVLRRALGENHPLYGRWTRVSFHAFVFVDGPTAFQEQEARREGIQEGTAIMKTAIFELSEESEETPDAKPGGAASGVFVVHGHAAGLVHEVARLIRRLTDEEPTILHEQANAGQTLIEKFEHHASSRAFAVVLATADDLGGVPSAEGMRPRARQNVVFEAGFFVGSLGRERVAILYEDQVELPSDIAGLLYIPLDREGAWKLKLARELRTAGLKVDLNELD